MAKTHEDTKFENRRNSSKTVCDAICFQFCFLFIFIVQTQCGKKKDWRGPKILMGALGKTR